MQECAEVDNNFFLHRLNYKCRWVQKIRVSDFCFIYEICHLRFRFMVFNATFNNISFISGQSVLLAEETGVPGENHKPVVSHFKGMILKTLCSTTSLVILQVENAGMYTG